MSYLISPLGDDPVELEALFPASRRQVFAAFVEPDKFARWLGGNGAVKVEIEPTLGGAWMAVFSDGPDGLSFVEGAYTEMDPVRRLAFTWRHVQVDRDGERRVSPLSEVTVTLDEEGASTRLRLRHKGVSEDGRKSVGPGWNASLERLGEVLDREG